MCPPWWRPGPVLDPLLYSAAGDPVGRFVFEYYSPTTSIAPHYLRLTGGTIALTAPPMAFFLPEKCALSVDRVRVPWNTISWTLPPGGGVTASATVPSRTAPGEAVVKLDCEGGESPPARVRFLAQPVLRVAPQIIPDAYTVATSWDGCFTWIPCLVRVVVEGLQQEVTTAAQLRLTATHSIEEEAFALQRAMAEAANETLNRTEAPALPAPKVVIERAALGKMQLVTTLLPMSRKGNVTIRISALVPPTNWSREEVTLAFTMSVRDRDPIVKRLMPPSGGHTGGTTVRIEVSQTFPLVNAAEVVVLFHIEGTMLNLTNTSGVSLIRSDIESTLLETAIPQLPQSQLLPPGVFADMVVQFPTIGKFSTLTPNWKRLVLCVDTVAELSTVRTL